MVEARITEEVFSAILDLHERNLGMFVTVMDGIEDIFLNSHGFGTLDQSNFSFPVYLKIGIGTNLELNQYGKNVFGPTKYPVSFCLVPSF